MAHRDELTTDNWQTNAIGPAFMLRATLKVIAILCAIAAELKANRALQEKIYETQLKQGHALSPEEARKVLGVSKTKLQSMKDNGPLIDGIHFRQDEGVLRYHPDLARLFINHSPENTNVEHVEFAEATSFAEKQAAQQHTKNFFKNKGK